MTEDVVNDILAHHGIMGMHWGSRKAETSAKQYAPKKTKLPPGTKPLNSVLVNGKKIETPKGTRSVYDFYTKHQRVICLTLLSASILTRIILRVSTGIDFPVPVPTGNGLDANGYLMAGDVDEGGLYHADDDVYELSEDVVAMLDSDSFAHSAIVEDTFAHFGIEDKRLPQEVTDILSHHGIMGMHWGHRKSTVKSVNKSITKTADKLHQVERHAISDVELKARINRIEMERKYAALTAPQKSPGKKIVHDLLTNLAKGIVTTLVNKVVADAIAKNMAGKLEKATLAKKLATIPIPTAPKAPPITGNVRVPGRHEALSILDKPSVRYSSLPKQTKAYVPGKHAAQEQVPGFDEAMKIMFGARGKHVL